MQRPTFVSCFIVAVWGIGLHGQRGANFSGSWVLDDGFKPSEVVAQRLTIQQLISNQDASGAPMGPEYSTLIVKRDFGNRTGEETYPIEPVGEPPSQPPVQSRQTRLAARWMGTAYLRLEQKVFTASGTALRTPWAETWRFDDGGRLIISVATTGPETDSQLSAYRREGK